MENRFLEFIKKYWQWGVFGALCFLSLSFLIFQEGIWAYLDSSYEVNILFENSLVFRDIFQNLMDFTFFSFDNSQILSTRFINIFSEIGITKFSGNFFQIAFLSFYFFLSFIFSKKCLVFIFRNNLATSLGGILYVFNPVTIFLLNEAGFFFVYFSMPLVIFSLIRYFQEKKLAFGHALLFAVGLSLLASYARVSFIYFGILFFLLVVFYQEIFCLLKTEKKKILILAGTLFLFLLPIFFSFAYPYFSGDKGYFAGIANYVKSFEKIESNIFKSHLEMVFFQGFIPIEFISNFLLEWHSNYFFQLSSLVYFFSGILFAMDLLKKRNIVKNHQKLVLAFLVILLGSVFLRMLAYFVNQDWFVKITYVYLPFLANTTSWIMLGFLVGFVGILAFILEYANKKERVLISFFTLVYIFISLWPLINFQNNPKLKTISIKDIPKEYQIFSQDEKAEASLFFPNKNLYFNWSPYPVDISRGKKYKENFSNNVRLVNDKQVQLYVLNYKAMENGTLFNSYLFNLKNVFVFKDVRNDDVGFDFFPKKDYVQLSKDYYEKMKNESSFFLKEENDHFAHFVRKEADKMGFFLYSPKTVLSINPEDFFQQGRIAFNRRATVVDDQAFHRPENLPVDGFSEEVKVSTKYSSGNTTKYFLKFENVEKDKNFLLQLNQTFGMSWKIKWVDKKTFEEKKCKEAWQEFPLSNNAVCRSDWNLFSWQDLKLLFASEVAESQHFEGNFVGNTWLVRSQDIPEKMQGKKELYAVVIYEKQIYYFGTLVVSGLTMGTLLLLVLRDFFFKYRERFSGNFWRKRFKHFSFFS